MGNKLWKFENGIYPVLPGMEMALGDYGYWRDNQWCHVGNIYSVEGCPRYFSVRKGDLNHDVVESVGTEIQLNGKGSMGINDVKAGAELKFQAENSLLFVGKLRKYEAFVSIDAEIKPFLKKMQEEGVWKDNYMLAYFIATSDKFVSLRSKVTGATVEVNADLNLENLGNLGVRGMFSLNGSSVESVSNIGDELKFAGAKFLGLEHHGFFKKEIRVKYNGENHDGILFT